MSNEATCSECRHWHALPIDPNNLAAPRMGLCRGVPPVPLVVGFQNTARGPMPQVQAFYPALAADMAVCGVFEGRVKES